MMRIQKKVFAVAAAVLIAANAGLTVSAAEWIVNENGGNGLMGGIYVCHDGPLCYHWEDGQASNLKDWLGVGGIKSYAPTTTSIVIPASFDGKSVCSLNWGAFDGFTALQTLTIPASVKGIGVGAFSGCEQLKDVYFGGTEEEWYEIWRMGEESSKEITEKQMKYTENESLLHATIHFGAESDVDVSVATPVKGNEGNGNASNQGSNGHNTSSGKKTTASTSSPKTGDNIWHVTLGAMASLGVLAFLRKKR